MSNILLYVSGSISCYKACELISLLVKKDFNVKVVASENALKFVGRASFEGLCHNRIFIDMFNNDNDSVCHITLPQKWADLIIAYPASADSINKLASGVADSLFGAICLANNYKKPLLIAPAMNSQMFLHPCTQSSLRNLKDWGTVILPCGTGYLACGDEGNGRLIEPKDALVYINKALEKHLENDVSLSIL